MIRKIKRVYFNHPENGLLIKYFAFYYDAQGNEVSREFYSLEEPTNEPDYVID